jgi:hypothetical protein
VSQEPVVVLYESTGDGLGFAVALSSNNGSIVAAGAPGNDVTGSSVMTFESMDSAKTANT